MARAGARTALLRTAREILDAAGTVEEVLWALWSGTSWPERLRARGRRAGGRPARLANRDLDAMCALFDTAARAEEQVGHVGVGDFLATLEAAADPRRHPGRAWHPQRVGAPADGAPVQGPGVAAGRGRARAGELVARPASTHDACCRPTASAPSGTPYPIRPEPPRRAARRGAPPVLRRLHPRVRAAGGHGRRLARTTRASSRPGSSPSSVWRCVTSRAGRPARCPCWGWSASSVARRRPRADPTLRDAAARRLARLARRAPTRRTPARPGGGPGHLVGDPRPEPCRAAGARPPTSRSSSRPARWPGWSSARRSGSSSERPAAGPSPARRQGFGNLVHAIADRVAKGELAADPGAVDELMVLVDDVWDQLGFRTPWSEDASTRRCARPSPGS